MAVIPVTSFLGYGLLLVHHRYEYDDDQRLAIRRYLVADLLEEASEAKGSTPIGDDSRDVRSTGRRFLQVDHVLDERNDLIKIQQAFIDKQSKSSGIDNRNETIKVQQNPNLLNPNP